MPLPSSDLKWLLIRKHNSFQIKKDGITFTTEPCNPTNISSFKFSGLANDKSVSVSSVNGEKKGIELTVKSKKGAKGAFSKYALNRNKKRNVAAIEKATRLSYYRGDLTKATVARYLKLRAALNSKHTDIKTIIEALKGKEDKEE
mmetsp:Transcript_21158/g.29666  ORF Transcript_21158/g.29666 Transcript_21158/m.29666 type:complete len:145 (+) Transcript_21158:146-580(+)|eukprot:CAMPEP_0185257966 /NCGR_PEP_ID=MMETSP1359-20130426/6964_1 /TAXON_ID=552665 /ORGANISM="Bigelowiella longifila, Strain CCMP242" /LENGTH=144 /DNA_ID=CAMNT_0027843277 /DNA_START=120 /DNA_END=554 /DNA_ORIENTATION=+